MAENKTVPTKASVKDFVAAIADEGRRADVKALIKLMGAATGEKAAMWGPSIIGFGTRHYEYESGRSGDMPLLGLSPRKAALVLYGATGFTGADKLLARLGKHTTGKGCLYLKKLGDADRAVLAELLRCARGAKR